MLDQPAQNPSPDHASLREEYVRYGVLPVPRESLSQVIQTLERAYARTASCELRQAIRTLSRYIEQ